MRRFVFHLVLLALALGGCSRKPAGTVVARVGEARLTKEDLGARIPNRFLGTVSVEERRRLVENWVEEELLYQEALNRKLDADPRVEARIQKAVRGLLVAELLERTYAGDAEVLEGEIRDYYETHQETFVREQPEIRVRHILVEDRDALTEASNRLQEGELFDQVAREMSVDTSAEEGGDLGYFTADMVDPSFWEACQEAKLGRTTRATTRLGYHLVEVLDRREAGSVRDLMDVRGEIRQRILAERRQGLREKLLEEIRKETAWSVDLDKLK